MNPGSNVADGSDRAQTSNLEALRATGAIPKNYAGIYGSDPVGSRGGVKSVDNGNRLPDSGLNMQEYLFSSKCQKKFLKAVIVLGVGEGRGRY